MKTRAAVAWQAGQPLTIEELDLDGPRAGEVLVEIKATGYLSYRLLHAVRRGSRRPVPGRAGP